MHKSILTFIFLLFGHFLSGQVQRDKIRVYFNNDEVRLLPEAKRQLDQLMAGAKDRKILKIYLSGHADQNADSLYNIDLSKRRNEAVQNYLVAQGWGGKNYVSSYYGENKPLSSDPTESGLQKNRRVDITVYYRKDNEEEPLPEIENIIVHEKDSCSGDTVIILKSGIKLIFNICEYKDKADCLDIIETNSGADIVDNGMATMSVGGEPLVSCGMFCIKWKVNEGCDSNYCFEKPVTVRIPMQMPDSCQRCPSPDLWGISDGEQNVWTTNNPLGFVGKTRRVKINGQRYLEGKIKCPGKGIWGNCDCKSPGIIKLKFKPPRKSKIISLTVYSDCPATAISYVPKGNQPKRRVKLKVPCNSWPEGMVVASIMDKNGNVSYLKHVSLKELKDKLRFGGCLPAGAGFFGKFFNNLGLRRTKYLIKKQNLDSAISDN